MHSYTCTPTQCVLSDGECYDAFVLPAWLQFLFVSLHLNVRAVGGHYGSWLLRCNNQCPAFLFATVVLCVCVRVREWGSKRQTQSRIQRQHRLPVFWAGRKWKELLLWSVYSLIWVIFDKMTLVLSQLPSTYTTDLGRWPETRKPITTNPIMSLECNMCAVNGLCCHFS